jgi:hypothetical protein
MLIMREIRPAFADAKLMFVTVSAVWMEWKCWRGGDLLGTKYRVFLPYCKNLVKEEEEEAVVSQLNS